MLFKICKNVSESVIQEAAIDICLVTDIVERVVYFLGFMEKVNIKPLIVVLLKHLHLAIGLSIFYEFL